MKKDAHSHTHKTLLEIHEDVPANHYDEGIKKNYFQKYWHWRRFREVLNISKPAEGRILDVGCHSGTFTKQIISKLKVKEVYGLDISPSAIKLANKRIPNGHFVVGDATKLPYQGNYFDEVFCLEMLEHIDDPVAVIKEIKRVLKKNKFGVILVPADNNLFKIVWFAWTLYYPVWRHAHVHSFRGKDLEAALQQVGLEIVKVKTFNLGMMKLVLFKK